MAYELWCRRYLDNVGYCRKLPSNNPKAPSSQPLTVFQDIERRLDTKRNEENHRTNYAPPLADFLCQSILGAAVTGLFFALADPRGE